MTAMRAMTMLFFGLMTLTGCAASEPDPFRGLEPEREVRAPANDTRPPAVLNGDPMTWEELRPGLSEAQGKAAVEEAALTRLLRAELSRAGMRITGEDAERERDLLIGSLSRASGEDPERLLARLRERRGLGPQRFRGLLERNAMLRALVRDSVEVSDDELRLAHRIAHGAKRRTRLILVASENEAAQIRARIVDAGSVRDAFISEAVQRSIDESAGVGGAIGAVSPDDPAWPVSLRNVIASTPPGSVSPIVALDAGAAIVLVEREVPADGSTLDEHRSELERDLRSRKERERMDALARSLLSRADLDVLDPGLRWSTDNW